MTSELNDLACPRCGSDTELATGDLRRCTGSCVNASDRRPALFSAYECRCGSERRKARRKAVLDAVEAAKGEYLKTEVDEPNTWTPPTHSSRLRPLDQVRGGRTLTNPLVEFIDEKIDLVLEDPQAWGGLEPLEPLILVLLMCRQFAAFGDDDEYTLLREYRRHLSKSVGTGSVRLADRLPEKVGRLDTAVDVLRKFTDDQRGERVVVQPESSAPSDRDREEWTEIQAVVYVRISTGQIIVTGSPWQVDPEGLPEGDPRAHDCDAAGCSSVSHVLARARLAGLSPGPVTNALRKLADFQRGAMPGWSQAQRNRTLDSTPPVTVGDALKELDDIQRISAAIVDETSIDDRLAEIALLRSELDRAERLLANEKRRREDALDATKVRDAMLGIMMSALGNALPNEPSDE